MPPGATGTADFCIPDCPAPGNHLCSRALARRDLRFLRQVFVEINRARRTDPVPSSEVIHANTSLSPPGLPSHTQLSEAGSFFKTGSLFRGSCPILSLCLCVGPFRANSATPNSGHTMMYLSDTEVADLCAPLTQPAAQVRYLRALGLTVTLKPNGRPVVIRCHAEAVLSGRRVASPLATTDQPSGAKQQPSRSSLVTLQTSQPAEPAAARLR